MDQKTAALLALYQSRGFLDARVTPKITDDYGNVPGRRYVTFQIQEGVRTTVNKLSLAGIDARRSADKLWPALLCKPMQPYSNERARSDRDRILDYLGDHGYTHASAEWRTTPGHRPPVDLEFDVAPGQQDRIQHIVILGNDHARLELDKSRVAFPRRRAASTKARWPSRSASFTISASLTRSRSLPRKNRLPIRTRPCWWAWRRLAAGASVTARVSKSNAWAATRPKARSRPVPRGSLSLTRLDVGGRGQTFSMGGRVSYIDTGADAGYLIPRLFNRDDLDLRIKGSDRSFARGTDVHGGSQASFRQRGETLPRHVSADRAVQLPAGAGPGYLQSGCAGRGSPLQPARDCGNDGGNLYRRSPRRSFGRDARVLHAGQCRGRLDGFRIAV